MELICFILYCFSVLPGITTMSMYWFYTRKHTSLKRRREVCIFCLYCLNYQSLLNLFQAGCPAPTLPPTPSHSSELALIRSTMMSLCANSGHCSDPIWLHNSAVFLNAISHFQFLATLPWPSMLRPSPAFPSISLVAHSSLLCGLSSIQPLDLELCKAKVLFQYILSF